ncbi:MAG: hypothetical protein NXI21_09815 [Alphaproteobacteria bacterium]|nr:hypothetical protein [Alphaproteobacteria bacterium]
MVRPDPCASKRPPARRTAGGGLRRILAYAAIALALVAGGLAGHSDSHAAAHHGPSGWLDGAAAAHDAGACCAPAPASAGCVAPAVSAGSAGLAPPSIGSAALLGPPRRATRPDGLERAPPTPPPQDLAL